MGGRVFNFDTEDQSKRTQHYEWLIPVHFKNTDSRSGDSQILYLQARTTTVQRTLVANTQVLDFGEIPVAFRKTQEILIKNTGAMDEQLQLQALTPFGGFSVLNAMRMIRPGETKPVVIQFEPHAQQIFEERVILSSDHTMVSVLLKGIGVRPEVKVEPEDRLLNFGNVLLGETAEKTFTVQNVSSFPVSFTL